MKTEAETRKELIDAKLSDAGWDVNNPSQVIQEFGISLPFTEAVAEERPSYGGYQFCDYVLLGRDRKPLAVVEAKKSLIDAAIGREQAKQYCYYIQTQYSGKLPFCFYTNGLDIYFWDLENSPPRKVIGYPTRDDLERFQHIREHKKPLADELINTQIAGREYQIRAIRAVMDGLEKKQRNFLLVMATGTGKTRTCIALVDALIRARHVERVLFLVDRIALREQGLAAFKEHLPNEPYWPKVGERIIAKDRRIYISTYPTMLNIIRDDKDRFSPHFFDLIVIDESHRSIYNTYGEVLDYFKTISLGLTATPTDIIDHNTFKLFNCDDGLPTFAYTYEEAVNNTPPYLCNFQVMKIQTKFQEEGISKRTISLEDQKRLILEGKEISDINFEGTDLEKTATNKGTNVLIVKEFMEESIKDANGVLPGKTIFFCSTKAHARRIEQIFDSLYPEYMGELAKVLVSDDPRVYGKGGLLDQFTNNDMPRIAISVDMMDTGIDIRELVNLVFAKPVYSYTKFWQMIGRGARLLDSHKLKPWCNEKEKFLILDFWDNFDYFKLNPKGNEQTVQVPLPVRFVGIRLDKIEKAIGLQRNDICHKEILKLRSQIHDLPQSSVVIREAAADLRKIEGKKFWDNVTLEKIEFLRTTIKPLFRAVSQTDFKAMRFQKDLLEASLAKLANKTQKFEALKDHIIELIGELPLSVNIVAREEAIIRLAQTNNYWSSITDVSFDELADRLSILIKYRDGDKRPLGPTQLDLKDMLKTKEMVEFGPENSTVSISKYREMVEKLIMELTESNPILQKIKAGQIITDAEAQELAVLLHYEHPHVTEDIFRSVYRNRKAKFLQFIRHIIGLEVLESFPETVEKAFEQFFQTHTNLSSRQLDFLNLLKEFILDKETVQKRDLIQSPFTVLHPLGIRGLFTPVEINEILDLTMKVAS
ncbi:DEAD/DEAH box helicase family protein [Paenibacillus sp. FSL R7-0198]|uniref:type I restriction endonuclease subunit R n=1 Tax=Paenibacillus sp. FSL R7-0198 TaxID=2921674 RepID=UPI0030F87908